MPTSISGVLSCVAPLAIVLSASLLAELPHAALLSWRPNRPRTSGRCPLRRRTPEPLHVSDADPFGALSGPRAFLVAATGGPKPRIRSCLQPGPARRWLSTARPTGTCGRSGAPARRVRLAASVHNGSRACHTRGSAPIARTRGAPVRFSHDSLGPRTQNLERGASARAVEGSGFPVAVDRGRAPVSFRVGSHHHCANSADQPPTVGPGHERPLAVVSHPRPTCRHHGFLKPDRPVPLKYACYNRRRRREAARRAPDETAWRGRWVSCGCGQSSWVSWPSCS